MTYMAGLDGSFILECSGFPGERGSLDFLPNENVYFLGKDLVTNQSAESVGFAGYFFIDDVASACVDSFNAQNNELVLVQGIDINFNEILPPRNRGFIKGDIVVGGVSGAVRSVGKTYQIYEGYERCSIKEIGYISTKHDLLNFPNKVNYNRSIPFNSNFFVNTALNSVGNRYACLSIEDRYPLPVPYTANAYGFKTACAVTPRHVIVANHVTPYSTNFFSFYNPSNQSIVTRNVIEYKNINTITDKALSEGLYGDNSYISGDLAIGLLNEPLPRGCVIASIPAYVDISSYPNYMAVNGIMISSDYRGYYINFAKNVNNKISFGSINQKDFSIVEKNTNSMFGAIGDSNSMIFVNNGSDLIFCGPVFSVSYNLAGLGGNYRGIKGASRFDFDFYVYPDSSGLLINKPSGRYRECTYDSSFSSFISIKDNLLEYIFTSQSVWGVSIDASHIPNRKIVNDFINIDISFDNYIDVSNYRNNKIKYIK